MKKAINTKNSPKENTILTGLTLKDVMPSTAKLNIFPSGYLLSPAIRWLRL